jgi:hypothetical protein
VLGVVTVGQGAGAHRIEFVRRIPGLRPADLAGETAEMGSARLGVSILVLTPFACLKARVQEAAHYLRPREEDLSHLMSLILCNRALLRETIKAVENETLPESKGLAALRAALRFVLTRPAVHAATMHQLDWLQVFPVVELLKTSRVRLQRFYAKGLQARFASCPRAVTDSETDPEQQQAA